jgi:hypothetical protein
MLFSVSNKALGSYSGKQLRKQIAVNTFVTSGSWQTASNWSLGVVPSSSHDVRILANVTTLGGNVTVNNIWVHFGITLSFGSAAIRTMVVNGDFLCNGTLIMVGQAHSLTLRGVTNECATLTTDATASTITFENTTSAGVLGFANRVSQVFGSLNYRNLTFSHNAGSGSVGSLFRPTSHIKVNGNFIQGSRCRFDAEVHNMEIVGSCTIQSSNSAGEYFRKTGAGTFIVTGAFALPSNSISLNFPFGLELKGSVSTISVGHSFAANSKLILTTSNKSLTTGNSSPNLRDVIINGSITITKNPADTGIAIIDNLSGDGLGSLIGNGHLTVTNNLGGVTYTP